MTSAAGGHGSYVPFAILFPYTLLSAHFTQGIGIPALIAAVCQFPLYAIFAVWSRRRWGSRGGFLVAAVVHTMAGVMALVWPPSFS